MDCEVGLLHSKENVVEPVASQITEEGECIDLPDVEVEGDGLWFKCPTLLLNEYRSHKSALENGRLCILSSASTSTDKTSEETQLTYNKRLNESDSDGENSSASSSCTSQKERKKRRTQSAGVLEFLSTYEQKQEERYRKELEQREKMHTDRMAMLKALIETMKKYIYIYIFFLLFLILTSSDQNKPIRLIIERMHLYPSMDSI